MEEKVCDTYFAKIYMGGDFQIAKNVCRRYCVTGLCVNIFETDYIYTWGEESGFCVELINYPRFPEGGIVLFDRANGLAMQLMDECFQASYTIVASDKTYFYSRKDELRR